MEAGVEVRRSSAVPGIVTGLLIALAAAAMLVTFLFLDVVDYTETFEAADYYGLEDDVIEEKYPGKDLSEEESDGAALLVWTYAAGGLAIILGLVALIPAVARRVWAVAIPAAIALGAWAIYSRVWFNDEYDHLSRLGPGGKISFYAAIAGVVIAVTGSIVVAVRNRSAQP